MVASNFILNPVEIGNRVAQTYIVSFWQIMDFGHIHDHEFVV